MPAIEAPAGLEEADHGDAGTDRKVLGIESFFKSRLRVGPAPNRKIITAHDDRPIRNPRLPQDDSGRREV